MKVAMMNYFRIKDYDDFQSNLDEMITATSGYVFIIINGEKKSLNLKNKQDVESIRWILKNPTRYHNKEYLTIYTDIEFLLDTFEDINNAFENIFNNIRRV